MKDKLSGKINMCLKSGKNGNRTEKNRGLLTDSKAEGLSSRSFLQQLLDFYAKESAKNMYND
jgi:hypothetical protein